MFARLHSARITRELNLEFAYLLDFIYIYILKVQ